MMHSDGRYSPAEWLERMGGLLYQDEEYRREEEDRAHIAFEAEYLAARDAGLLPAFLPGATQIPVEYENPFD